MIKLNTRLLLCALALAALAASACAHTIDVLIAGQTHSLKSRDIKGKAYISVHSLAAASGGTSYYFPVSNRIELRLRGVAVDLTAGSSLAVVAGQTVTMPAKTIWHWFSAYVPAPLLASPVFSSLTGISLVGNPPLLEASAPAPVAAPAPVSAPVPAPTPIGAPAPIAVIAPAPLPPPPSAPRRIRIVIDAGHGGKDSGAIGVHGLMEKKITLLAAKELAGLFAKSGRFDVLMTRDDDVFIPLSGRSAIANNNQADIFVSLHCNSAPERHRQGFEIYSMSEQATDPEAERLSEYENSVVAMEGKPSQETQAQLLLDVMGETEFYNDGAKLAALVEREAASRFPKLDGGAHRAGFYVLRGTHAPAILVEMDYISNKKGANRLLTKSFRQKLMESVYAGVLDYVKMERIGS